MADRRTPARKSILVVALAMTLGAVGAARAQSKTEEYYDTDYGFSFRYPAAWRLQKLPEGEANRDIRAMLQGPSGSSFMAIVEKKGEKNAERSDAATEEHVLRVETLMSQTIEQVYKTVSANIKAVDMTVGDRRDISNGVATKFYISTLHKMSDGKPIIVAGIHAYPFGKNYGVSFIMSAFWEGKPTPESDELTAVFNSFRLLGEGPPAGEPASPAAADDKK